jgi:uncharacterized membrane protein
MDERDNGTVAPGPMAVLAEAIKAVPAMRYALGALGLLSVLAMIGVWRISPQLALAGVPALLVAMVALVTFAQLTRTSRRDLRLAALAFLWSFLSIAIGVTLLLCTSWFWEWPQPIDHLLKLSVHKVEIERAAHEFDLCLEHEHDIAACTAPARKLRELCPGE